MAERALRGSSICSIVAPQVAHARATGGRPWRRLGVVTALSSAEGRGGLKWDRRVVDGSGSRRVEPPVPPAQSSSCGSVARGSPDHARRQSRDGCKFGGWAGSPGTRRSPTEERRGPAKLRPPWRIASPIRPAQRLQDRLTEKQALPLLTKCSQLRRHAVALAVTTWHPAPVLTCKNVTCRHRKERGLSGS